MLELTPAVVKRIQRAGGGQERNGKCLICTKPFQSCEHTYSQVDHLLYIYRVQQTVKEANTHA
jgi:5-methylcytosine-specific restriction endonuclease McrA